MQGIGVSVLSGAGPRIQNAGPPHRPLGAHVEERLADVENALQTNAERSDLANLVLLRSADGLVQRLTVLVGERPVVRHEKRGATEKTVLCIRPAALQDHEPEPLRTCVVGVLDQFPEQGASIPGVFVDVGQKGLDRLDLVKRASGDAGVGSDIDLGQAFFVGAFIHESGGPTASVAED